MKRRIVAEITRNWIKGKPDPQKPLLSQQFEAVIEVNAARGYSLESWRFYQLLVSKDELSETIIAVFVRWNRKPNP